MSSQTYLNGYVTKKGKIQKNGKTYYPFVITSEAIDWVGDKIIVKGIDITTYKSNPVVFYNHQDDLIIGNSEVELSKDGKQIIGYVYLDEISEKSRLAKKQIEAGTLRSASIGLQVLEWSDREPTSEEKASLKNKPYLDVISEITKSRMVEWSLVTIGMNPEALIMRAEQKGFNFGQIRKIKSIFSQKKKEPKMAKNRIRRKEAEIVELTEVVEDVKTIQSELGSAGDALQSFIAGVNSATTDEELAEFVRANINSIDGVLANIATALQLATDSSDNLETVEEEVTVILEDTDTSNSDEDVADVADLVMRLRRLERGYSRLSAKLNEKIKSMRNDNKFNLYLKNLKGGR